MTEFLISNDKSSHKEKINAIVHTLSEKGSFDIIHFLDGKGTLRFNKLKQYLYNISPRTMAKRLKQLESFELINRKAYAEIPPKVEYSLTDRGKKLATILNQIWKMLEDWYL